MTEPGLLEAAALATEQLETMIVGGVRDVHTSVSGRVHSVLDRALGSPAVSHRIHDGIATGVYAGIGLGLRAATKALRGADRLGMGPSIEDTPKGRFVV